MALSLMQKSTLTIGRDDGGGFWDAQGRWTVDPTTASFTIKCSIQPFQMGTNQLILPEGKTTSDARLIRTTTFLKTSDQFGEELADTTTIDGNTYYAKAVEDWNLHGLSTDHFKVLFVRKDKPTNGEL
jgi:hypothetical protein